MALGLVAATLATPVAIALTFGALYSLQFGWFAGQDVQLVLDNVRLYAMMSAPVALFVTLAAGAPVAHQLAHRGHTGPLRHTLVGAVLGALPFVLFDGYIIATKVILYVSPSPDFQTVLTTARWAGLGAWCGMWSATAYWVVAIRERSRP